MIRFLDQIVSDWQFYNWRCHGEDVVQVQVSLWNGMVFYMNFEDFMLLTDDEPWY